MLGRMAEVMRGGGEGEDRTRGNRSKLEQEGGSDPRISTKLLALEVIIKACLGLL